MIAWANQGRLPGRDGICSGPERWADILVGGKEKPLAWTWDEERVWCLPGNSEQLATKRRAHEGVARVRLLASGHSAISCKEPGLAESSQGWRFHRTTVPRLLPEHLPKSSRQQVLRGLKDSLLPPCVLGCRVFIVPPKEQASSQPWRADNRILLREPSREWRVLRQLQVSLWGGVWAFLPGNLAC